MTSSKVSSSDTLSSDSLGTSLRGTFGGAVVSMSLVGLDYFTVMSFILLSSRSFVSLSTAKSSVEELELPE